MSAGAVSRRFDRAISVVPEIAAFVREWFERERLGSAHLEPVQLAVEEVFTNMVKYSGGKEHILIELCRSDSEVSVSLTDFDVDRFDIRATPEVNTAAPLESRRPGGLGIHLVKKLMDRIDYRYEDRCGTTTVVRRLV